MRIVEFKRNYLMHPAGSCLASYGDTKVVCSASIEESVPRFVEESGGGWITAEYAMLPGSTGGGRKRREIFKRDGRSTEIQRLIGRSLRAAVDMEKIGPVSIIVDCDVLQADGGTRTVSISGGWVALYDALTVLAKRNGLSSPDGYLRGQAAALSVGIVDGNVVCDLDYEKDSRAEVDMNVVFLGKELIEIQGTGERDTFNRSQLDEMLDTAEEGAHIVYTAQRRALGIL
ncbi:MAG: ribonuclease PH [Spirochaetaceae bacterium]